MNLYRIIVLHGAPKDSHKSTETYLAAENEGIVADWICENKEHGYWFGDADDPKVRRLEIQDKQVPFRDYVLINKGDLDDEEGWEDAYYGVTKWGWEIVNGVTQADIDRLISLEIAEPA